VADINVERKRRSPLPWLLLGLLLLLLLLWFFVLDRDEAERDDVGAPPDTVTTTP